MSDKEKNQPIEILLVEDDPVDIRTVQKFLSNQKINTHLTIVNDGGEALTALYHAGKHTRAPVPDMILLDIFLPMTDGERVIRYIKKDLNLQKVPIVILSGHRIEEKTFQTFGIPENCFLEKWEDLDKLTNFLQMVAQHKEAFFKDPNEKKYLTSPNAPIEEDVNQICESNETILVVDDEDTVRKTVSTTLRKKGYRVLEAINGPEALELVKEGAEEIHLLLTDIVMPTMNGYELAKKLLTQYPDLKVLFITGHAKLSLSSAKRTSIEQHLLRKPFESKKLTQRVRDTFHQPQELN